MAAPDPVPEPIEDYHVHVYFGPDSREPAKALREDIEQRFDITMGRWHEKAVGPHPEWSYQVKFGTDLFAELVPWLMQNRRGLTILVHPNTGNDLADHRDWPIWMGEIPELNLAMFED